MSTLEGYKRRTIIIPVLLIVLSMFYYVSTFNFLFVHTLIELAGVVVASTIFIIGWNTKEYTKNNFLIILSIGYSVVALVSVMHTLLYSGMNIFSDISTDIPTKLHLLARYVEAITLFIAVLLVNYRKKIQYNFFLTVKIFFVSLIVLIIFSGILPISYVEGEGVTLYKVINEFIIIFILILTAVLLYKRRVNFERDIYENYLAAIILTAISELLFTLYKDPYAFMNYMGHIFMLFSVLLIYRTNIKATLTRPYQILFNHVSGYANELSLKNDELRIKDFAIESSLSAIVLTDIHGYPRYINQSCLTLLGYQRKEDFIGLAPESIFVDPNMKAGIKNYLLQQGNWYGEAKIRKANGDLMDGLMTVNYIQGQDGKPINIMATFIDISDRKKTELALLEAKKEAESASEAKSSFLANMSHEIRTPMNGIIGFLHLLENSQIDQTQMSYINSIKISSDTLLSLINDILDMSKIEAGKMELEMIPTEIHTTIKNAVIPFLARIDEKNLDFDIQIDSKMPQFVVCDPIRLKQIIGNIISNAIKFTDYGSIEMYVSYKGLMENHHQIEFMIKDSGIGMSKEALDRIFQPFSQADVSSTRKYGGTGLGLAICKSFIEMMGGSIRAESEVSQGTSFIFNLSLPSVNTKVEEQEKKKVTNYASNSDEILYQDMKILLVEDNEVNRSLFTMLLQTKGIECDLCENGREAADAVLEKQYDIIFMDCQMPVMNGFDATNLIRKHEKQHTTIVALTASAMKGDAERCFSAGMDDYLSKPINIDQLTAILDKYYKKNNKDNLI
jgi:PAS domain S-box-containing protein